MYTIKTAKGRTIISFGIDTLITNILVLLWISYGNSLPWLKITERCNTSSRRCKSTMSVSEQLSFRQVAPCTVRYVQWRSLVNGIIPCKNGVSCDVDKLLATPSEWTEIKMFFNMRDDSQWAGHRYGVSSRIRIGLLAFAHSDGLGLGCSVGSGKFNQAATVNYSHFATANFPGQHKLLLLA